MITTVLIGFIFSSLTFATVAAENTSSPGDKESYCVLPPYPKYGTYTVKNIPAATPGGIYPSVKLDVSCNTGFGNDNSSNSIFCVNGDWSSSMPTCVPFCNLSSDLSVEYRCELKDSKFLQRTQECDPLVPTGTIVTPLCREPGYFSLGELKKMHCIDGSWNYIPICQQACGTLSPHLELVASSNSVEVSWHTGIYRKTSENYLQICGGSLISSTKIISAAHCFWSVTKRMLEPASNYAVAVGKLYRPFNDPRDTNSQQADVVDIKIPPLFQGSETNLKNDIAIVIVEKPFVFHLSVRPVCLNFDYNLDRILLVEGNKGKAAGWGVNDQDGKVSPLLKVVNVPYITFEDCYKISPPFFRKEITSDKLCTTPDNGKSVCRGDSGGGLAFLESTSQRYYLLGVISVGPANDDGFCDTFTGFTSIIKHEHFITQFL